MNQKPYCYALSNPVQETTIVCFKEYRPEWDFTIPLFIEPAISDIDCRACQYFDNARTRCGSITMCFNAENYEGIPFVQLWTENPNVKVRG